MVVVVKAVYKENTDVSLFETKEIAMKFIEQEYPRFYEDDPEEGYEHYWCFGEFDDESESSGSSDTRIYIEEDIRVINTINEIKKKKRYTDEYYKRKSALKTETEEFEKSENDSNMLRRSGFIRASVGFFTDILSFDDYLKRDVPQQDIFFVKSPKMKIIGIQSVKVPVTLKDIYEKSGIDGTLFKLEYEKDGDTKEFLLTKILTDNRCFMNSSDKLWVPKVGEYMKFVFYTHTNYDKNLNCLIMKKN